MRCRKYRVLSTEYFNTQRYDPSTLRSRCGSRLSSGIAGCGNKNRAGLVDFASFGVTDLGATAPGLSNRPCGADFGFNAALFVGAGFVAAFLAVSPRGGFTGVIAFGVLGFSCGLAVTDGSTSLCGAAAEGSVTGTNGPAGTTLRGEASCVTGGRTSAGRPVAGGSAGTAFIGGLCVA